MDIWRLETSRGGKQGPLGSGFGFRGLGFRGLGFRGLGFRGLGFGFRLGFRVGRLGVARKAVWLSIARRISYPVVD